MYRDDFPILSRQVYNKPLVYLDNAATTQKPKCVVESIVDEYYNVNANVHRGVHFLSQQATDLHENSRETVRKFINANSTSEILFTRGTTESINLLAYSFGEAFMEAGDEILISEMEHHSNIVPWQILAERKELKIKVIPITDEGQIDMEAYGKLLSESDSLKLVCITQVSNVLGTINPVKAMVDMAHDKGVKVLVDGAQSTPHFKVDMHEIGCDFFAFSGHKIYGPTGVGVLYGKEEYLEQMPPYQGGGEMIKNVSFSVTTYNGLPYKFEAGTPDYVGTHALATALNYVDRIGMDKIRAYEEELTEYALRQLRTIDYIKIYGHCDENPGDAVISFNVGSIHHLDLGTLLDRLGIAVRTGHHCAEPLMRRLGVEGTVRASFALYNTKEEVDTLVEGIKRVQKMF